MKGISFLLYGRKVSVDELFRDPQKEVPGPGAEGR